jgi:hypothetical protein
MTSLTLPAAIAAYFAADRRGAAELANCFTPSAVVQDEGRTHSGRSAILAWKAKAAAAYDYASQPFALKLDDGVHTVTAHVVGNFPGSPVDLRYRFRLEGPLIASLEIAP